MSVPDCLYSMTTGHITSVLLPDGRWYRCDPGRLHVEANEFYIDDSEDGDGLTAGPLTSILAVRGT